MFCLLEASATKLTAMQLTYFFDVCSMWCALADEVLAGIQKRYGDRVPITRKIALINDGAPMAAGLEQEQWYYQRCEATTGRRFDHRWIEKRGQLTWLPNALIYASEKLGYGDKVHEALKLAGLTGGSLYSVEMLPCKSRFPPPGLVTRNWRTL